MQLIHARFDFLCFTPYNTIMHLIKNVVYLYCGTLQLNYYSRLENTYMTLSFPLKEPAWYWDKSVIWKANQENRLFQCYWVLLFRTTHYSDQFLSVSKVRSHMCISGNSLYTYHLFSDALAIMMKITCHWTKMQYRCSYI